MCPSPGSKLKKDYFFWFNIDENELSFNYFKRF